MKAYMTQQGVASWYPTIDVQIEWTTCWTPIGTPGSVWFGPMQRLDGTSAVTYRTLRFGITSLSQVFSLTTFCTSCGPLKAIKMKLVLAVLLLAFTGGIEALNCYTCTNGAPGVSTNTADCDDTFDVSANSPNVIKLDCSSIADIPGAAAAAEMQGVSNFDTCAKTFAYVNGRYMIARTCFDSSLCPERNGCYSANGGTVCCCNGDYCNGAAAVGYNAIITMAVIGVALILMV